MKMTDGFKEFTKIIGDKLQIVGDDLFVTNKTRLLNGVESKSETQFLSN